MNINKVFWINYNEFRVFWLLAEIFDVHYCFENVLSLQHLIQNCLLPKIMNLRKKKFFFLDLRCHDVFPKTKKWVFILLFCFWISNGYLFIPKTLSTAYYISLAAYYVHDLILIPNWKNKIFCANFIKFIKLWQLF